MGACDISFTLKGKVKFEEIGKAFRHRQGIDQIENGHQSGYSGDFQTVDKVIDRTYQVFDSYEEAFDYCLENCEKWVSVVAVRYKDGDKINTLVAGWGAC
jgi:hypothetical protein